MKSGGSQATKSVSCMHEDTSVHMGIVTQSLRKNVVKIDLYGPQIQGFSGFLKGVDRNTRQCVQFSASCRAECNKLFYEEGIKVWQQTRKSESI